MQHETFVKCGGSLMVIRSDIENMHFPTAACLKKTMEITVVIQYILTAAQ